MMRCVSISRLFAVLAILAAALLAGATRVLDISAHGQAAHPFEPIASVLQHPRCVNCHPNGNTPLQGDDHHPHQMKVNRGVDGSGSVVARCYACHRDQNSDLSIVPGAPSWKLAPAGMAWFGLSSRELCTVLKDRTQNGNRSLDDLVEHMDNDPLVRWGWNPGRGRAPVPIPHTQFVAFLKTWAAAGGPCP